MAYCVSTPVDKWILIFPSRDFNADAPIHTQSAKYWILFDHILKTTHMVILKTKCIGTYFSKFYGKLVVLPILVTFQTHLKKKDILYWDFWRKMLNRGSFYTHEKTSQNNFSCQTFCVENNYFCDCFFFHENTIRQIGGIFYKVVWTFSKNSHQTVWRI